MREPVPAGDVPSARRSQSRPQPRPALPPLESRCLSKQAVPAKAHIFYLGSCVPTVRETLDLSEDIPAEGRIIRKRFYFPVKCVGRSPGGGGRAGRPLGLGAACLSSSPDPAPVLSLHLLACGSPSPLRWCNRPHARTHGLSCLLTTTAAEAERAGGCGPDGSEAERVDVGLEPGAGSPDGVTPRTQVGRARPLGEEGAP